MHGSKNYRNVVATQFYKVKKIPENFKMNMKAFSTLSWLYSYMGAVELSVML